jgi:hypothetical protein
MLIFTLLRIIYPRFIDPCITQYTDYMFFPLHFIVIVTIQYDNLL